MRRIAVKTAGILAAAGVICGLFPVHPEVYAASSRKTVGNFVERMYNVVLGRASDPEGKKGWMEQLKGGTGAVKAAWGFVFSREYREKNSSDEEYVHCLYHLFLDRDPDKGGYNTWLRLLDRGASREDVFCGIGGSAEFRQEASDLGIRPGSPDGAVPGFADMDRRIQITGAYRKLLGRSPSERELAVRVGEMKRGVSRGSIYRSILGSRERCTQTVTALYQNILEREPDAVGLEGWVRAMAGGMSAEEIGAAFRSSPEYGKRYPDDAAFVRMLYRDYLGREAESRESREWADQLSSGRLTRRQVCMRISSSREGKTRCVRECYDLYLGRTASGAETEYWVRAAADRAAIYGGILCSREYMDKTEPWEMREVPPCPGRIDTTSDDNDDPTHTHEWTDQVIRHEAEGHYERVQVGTERVQTGTEWGQTGTETVIVQEAWDEPVYERRISCLDCGAFLTVTEERHNNAAFIPGAGELDRLFPDMCTSSMGREYPEIRWGNYSSFGSSWNGEACSALAENEGNGSLAYWMGCHSDVYGHNIGSTGTVTVGFIRHDAVTAEEPVYGWIQIYEDRPVYEDKWTEDTPAREETVTVCRICGDRK